MLPHYDKAEGVEGRGVAYLGFLTCLGKKALSFLVGGCQNYDPFWGTLNIRCRILIGTQKGTIILTTTLVNNRTYQEARARHPKTPVRAARCPDHG